MLVWLNNYVLQECQKYQICRHQMCSFKLQMHQNPFAPFPVPFHPIKRRLRRLDLGACSSVLSPPPSQKNSWLRLWKMKTVMQTLVRSAQRVTYLSTAAQLTGVMWIDLGRRRKVVVHRAIDDRRSAEIWISDLWIRAVCGSRIYCLLASFLGSRICRAYLSLSLVGRLSTDQRTRPQVHARLHGLETPPRVRWPSFQSASRCRAYLYS